LTVVHSLDYVTPMGAEAALAFQGTQPGLSSEELQRIADARDRLSETLDHLGIEGQIRVAHGPADKALIQIAAELQADLLVVGTVGRTGFRRVLLGSVAEAVARHAPCSVLIVRQHPQ
jgi:nucleotide-binding universal stress UspA family protein